MEIFEIKTWNINSGITHRNSEIVGFSCKRPYSLDLLYLCKYLSSALDCCSCYWLGFPVLPTSQVIPERVPTVTVRTHGNFYNAAPLGGQAASIITWYPTQSYYCDTKLISPCLIQIMLNARLGTAKYQFDKSLVCDEAKTNNKIK